VARFTVSGTQRIRALHIGQRQRIVLVSRKGNSSTLAVPRRWLSSKPLSPLEEVRQATASKNLRILSLIFVTGSLATVAGMWSEIKTSQIETWVTRVYDTFVILNTVGKFELTDEEPAADGADAGEVDVLAADMSPAEREQASRAKDETAAVDIWKFLLQSAAVRDGGDVISWDVVREHPFVATAAENGSDLADVFTELSDADGPGVSRGDFLALCGEGLCFGLFNAQDACNSPRLAQYYSTCFRHRFAPHPV